MILATLNDKPAVVEILTRSFETNKSVNYVIKQDARRYRRIQLLMEYSFHKCLQFGDVFLSDDKNGCALLIYPDKQQTTLQTIIWESRIALFALGLGNLIKTLKRETEIKKRHPVDPITHLWFIGVSPGHQHRGIGSKLLLELLQHSKDQRRNIFLETSTIENLHWYERFGFHVYDDLNLGYKLYFLKRG